jgi:hypothetical protein
MFFFPKSAQPDGNAFVVSTAAENVPIVQLSVKKTPSKINPQFLG